MKRWTYPLSALLVMGLAACSGMKEDALRLQPTVDNGDWFFLDSEALTLGNHHQRHAEVFGRYVTGYNYYVLRGIDTVQGTAPDGGDYFIGIKADPPESPIGYELRLFGGSLLKPPRTTSYCSGASYTAFIEALNLIFPDGAARLGPERFEAMRMQEPDGGRREDGIKYWGHWNDDGYGSHYALAQYSGMGIEVTPQQARPGDFMNITWTNGGGHSVVFLGWIRGEAAGEGEGADEGKRQEPGLLFWSSQKSTNGLADQRVPLSRVRVVKIVRLTQPENLFTFDVTTPVQRRIPADRVSWN